MNSSIRHFAVFLIIATLLQACSGETHVQIYNTLPGGVTLTVNCKSNRGVDLGFQKITPSGMWEFHFRPRGARYSCSFQWPGQFNYFDIYIEERDDPRCYDKCQWFVLPTGPCLERTMCEKWNS
ncbi:hypothetical protein BT93_L0849 [Corymbia citriodora subsp. variegata]|uniref:S-protein homolog n=1 Tax=Corymbia citriodora subsp. variegata TaxID=360336 RepID=A0A8T0CP02_CORYI|nr:hypothetical protein BT93_L0849 [Corymbia citriodora subsp. variegata]